MNQLNSTKKPYVSFKDYVNQVEESIRIIRSVVNHRGVFTCTPYIRGMGQTWLTQYENATDEEVSTYIELILELDKQEVGNGDDDSETCQLKMCQDKSS